ncbi:testis-specific serine/threonine-protein kinase 6-like [Numida meleagris]|uniref:testis-specific serine/threonine-protein kinase 6-like n=1 Tax=Numida meleagris TaxID=8996 RepID=UPI000B3E3526|nr:testis-specific serine/threonine-protein kinase 6-like [Numida meleagris]
MPGRALSPTGHLWDPCGWVKVDCGHAFVPSRPANMPNTDAEKKLLHKLGFTLGETLGEGSFSKVKAATSPRYTVPLAIKILDKRRAPKAFVQKFLPQELSIVRELHHPNIVLFFETFELSNGMVYIVMESAATDLQQRLQQLGKLPCVPDARDIFVQVVGAMHYLHDRNIVHRDLKCDNILLSADGRQAKIADFGFSKEVSSYPEPSTTFCGTEAYMAPEMWLQYPHDAKKLDVWSLGVVLFVMVTGDLPFHGCLCHVIQQQEKGVLHLRGVSLLPEPCQALIAELLQFFPSSRPSVEQVAGNSWLKGDI